MTARIVAKFGGFESCIFVILFLALLMYVAASAYAEVYLPGVGVFGSERPALRWHPDVIPIILLSPFIILVQLTFLWQLAFGKRAAAWIDDGQLILFNWFSVIPLKNYLYTRIALKDIDHFSAIPAKPFRSSSVVVHLKDGNQKYLSALLLADNAATLMPRLSAVLA